MSSTLNDTSHPQEYFLILYASSLFRCSWNATTFGHDASVAIQHESLPWVSFVGGHQEAQKNNQRRL